MTPSAKQDVVGDDNFKLGYGWFSKAVALVDQGANRITSGTGINTTATGLEIQYVDATPQRKGRPEDIAFRSMPAHGQTRYAAGLEKMSIYGIPAVFGEKRQERMGRRAARMGRSWASMYFSHTTRSPTSTASSTTTRSSSTTRPIPSA